MQPTLAIRLSLPVLVSTLDLCVGCSRVRDDGAPTATTIHADGGGLDDASGDSGDSGDRNDASVQSPTDAGAPALRYVGRFEATDGGMRDGFPGSRVIARFEGTRVEATFIGRSGMPHYDVIVDGVARSAALVIPAGRQDVTLASDLGAGVHTVEIMKRAESYFGSAELVDVRFPRGQLLAPPAAAPRRIEVVAHSAANGFGIEGPGPSCPNGATAASANAGKSAPFLSAIALNADLVLLGYSGRGLTTAAAPVTFPMLFERTNPESASPPWRHEQWVPDVLLLFAISFTDLDASDPILAEAYATFVARARFVYPTTHVFLVLSAYATDNYPVGKMARTRTRAIQQEVVRRRMMLSDSRVYAYEMTAYVDGQLTGCDYHPGIALHEQMAREMTPWIATRLGW